MNFGKRPMLENVSEMMKFGKHRVWKLACRNKHMRTLELDFDLFMLRKNGDFDYLFVGVAALRPSR